MVVRDAETAEELARALIGGGDRCVLEEPSLAFVLPHARVEFDERPRFDRFKRLLLVSQELVCCCALLRVHRHPPHTRFSGH